jgi:methylenetetrahydrofolate dehydrogenase (NADP+)/methenyltetrahydrofolate cyclohydrolase
MKGNSMPTKRPAKIIDGKAVSRAILDELKEEIATLKAGRKGITPGLAVVLVGSDPASQVYVRSKRRTCEELGINSYAHDLPASTSERKLLNLVKKLNEDPKVHGILVQMPLPKHIDEQKVLNAIDPNKDVDGFHPVNVGRLLNGEECFVACTPAGCQELLVRSGNDPAGKHVVVVGRSNIVGKPVAALLMQKGVGGNATVTVCHSRTKNLASITKQADILIAAIGIPEFVTARMVKDRVVVIDVGINRVEDKSKKSGYRLVGDVAFAGVRKKAKAITPVPGGVGPMTIAMLMKNTVAAARRAGA